jgi:hypothetical protein
LESCDSQKMIMCADSRAVVSTAGEYGGPCAIVSVDHHTTRMRSTVLIRSRQGIDLFWATTSLDREEALRPIRIPLLKGLMGHRVLLIQADDQDTFSQVKTLEDLQKLRAGQGADWPDTGILRSNGIEVVTSSYYDALPRMLAAGRFDFFPRGAAEVLAYDGRPGGDGVAAGGARVLRVGANGELEQLRGFDAVAGRERAGDTGTGSLVFCPPDCVPPSSKF